MAMSLHGTIDPMTAALQIVIGNRREIDILSVHSGDKFERFVISMMSYGYLGDLMKHSETLRWLGRKRYDISGVRTFFKLKSYSGEIRCIARRHL